MNSQPDIRQQLDEIRKSFLPNNVELDKLVALISQIVSSVIGEDTPYSMNNHGTVNAENYLRVRQRATLKRLIGDSQ